MHSKNTSSSTDDVVTLFDIPFIIFIQLKLRFRKKRIHKSFIIILLGIFPSTDIINNGINLTPKVGGASVRKAIGKQNHIWFIRNLHSSKHIYTHTPFPLQR